MTFRTHFGGFRTHFGGFRTHFGDPSHIRRHNRFGGPSFGSILACHSHHHSSPCHSHPSSSKDHHSNHPSWSKGRRSTYHCTPSWSKGRRSTYHCTPSSSKGHRSTYHCTPSSSMGRRSIHPSFHTNSMMNSHFQNSPFDTFVFRNPRFLSIAFLWFN